MDNKQMIGGTRTIGNAPYLFSLPELLRHPWLKPFCQPGQRRCLAQINLKGSDI